MVQNVSVSESFIFFQSILYIETYIELDWAYTS